MNFVARKDQLEEIKSGLPSVTEMVRFDSGKAYADFQEGDKVATYGMADLIAAGAGAKIAAKAGLLVIALALLKKGGFLIVVADVAIAQFLRGLLGRKTPTRRLTEIKSNPRLGSIVSLPCPAAELRTSSCRTAARRHRRGARRHSGRGCPQTSNR